MIRSLVVEYKADPSQASGVQGEVEQVASNRDWHIVRAFIQNVKTPDPVLLSRLQRYAVSQGNEKMILFLTPIQQARPSLTSDDCYKQKIKTENHLISTPTYKKIVPSAKATTVSILDKSKKIISGNRGNRVVTLNRFQLFKSAYMKQYKSEFFKNPWSTMKHKLENNEISSISEVEEYVKNDSDTRSLKILSWLPPVLQ